MGFSVIFNKLKSYIEEVSSEHRLSREDGFAWWYCQAALLDPENKAEIEKSITNGPKDLGCDIVLISEPNETVYICQTKLRESMGSSAESRSEILQLTTVAQHLLNKNKRSFDAFIKDGNDKVKKALQKAQTFVQRHNYKVYLIYLTTGNVSQKLQNQANTVIKTICNEFGIGKDKLKYIFINGKHLCKMFEGFEYYVPSIPYAELELIGDISVPESEENSDSPICKVFTTSAKSIWKLFKDYEDRLFARNIRLSVGPESSVNKDIRDTLLKKPRNFFYMNNGITILAHSFERRNQNIGIFSPQIINGQQTTRTIGSLPKEKITKDTHVLVKIISPPVQGDSSFKDYRTFIFDVIRASNSQNKINISELFSNNREHVEIEKNLLHRKWQYERKKGVYLTAPMRINRPIGKFKMRDLALAVLANNHDPQRAPSIGTTAIYDPNSREFKTYYSDIFDPKRKTDEILLHYLATQVSSYPKSKVRDENLQDLHTRGRWYVSNYLFGVLSKHLKSKSEKVLAAVGHKENRRVLPASRIKKAVFLLHDCLRAFYSASLKKEKHSARNFYKSKLAELNKWNSFLKKKCKSELKQVGNLIKKELA